MDEWQINEDLNFYIIFQKGNFDVILCKFVEF